ncbi:MAG TPA: PDZ domain-containing protein [Planktothrix sp.]|jgi:tricorn protease
MSEPGYYRYPTIAGDTIVFACEDDLWTVSARGGIARRLTAGQGECSMPRFSPDGTQVAFIGRDEGHPEVFVIPSDGGLARRLTYMGGFTCNTCCWTADGKEIVFTSEAQAPFFRHSEAFAVPLSGGLPRPLKLGHVQSISFGRNKTSAIGRNNNDPARWKRYRGGTAGEIWVDAKGNGEFAQLKGIDGNLVLPMFIGDRVYFLSDHDGVGNIYSCKPNGTDIVQHTRHTDYFARFPCTDGKRIVYACGADIWLLDPEKKINQKVEIVSPSATTQVARKFVDARWYLENFSLHPKGHSVALISRGQPLTMGNWEGAVIQHGAGSRVRYRNAEWLSDGERFVVVSDAGGQERIELHRADQTAQPQIIAGDFGRVVELRVSPASDMVALSNHRQELVVVDLATKKVKVIDRSPAERIGDLAWSPDGRWIAYAYAPLPSTTIIRIADAKGGAVHDITNPVRADYSPAWDPEGKYLFFLGARDYFPIYDAMQFDLGFPSSFRPFVVTLRKDVPSPFIQKPRPIVGGKGEDKPGEKPAETNGAKHAGKKGVVAKKTTRGAKGHAVANNGEKTANGKTAEKEPIKIDFDDIQSRILGFPVAEGRYAQLVASRGRVLFTRYTVRGIRPGFNWADEPNDAAQLFAYVFEEQRMAPVAKEVGSIRIAADAQTLIYRWKERLRVMDAQVGLPNEGAEPAAPGGSGRKSGWLDLGRAHTLVQPLQEWEQMYEEAWRLQRDQFWDEAMSNVDWNVVRQRYAKLLKRVRTRSELSDIIWEMQGELGTSHAYEMGGDYRPTRTYYRGFLGADFAWDDKRQGYRVQKIVRGDSWSDESDSPLAVPGVGIAEGDVIVAVNGRAVSKEYTIDELLINNANREINLTVAGTKSGERKNIVARTLRTETTLRYRQWVNANRRYVHEKTGGRIGYVHIPDMGPVGYAEFHNGYLSEVHRDGLIVDARYNRGGHVSPLLLEKLNRRRVGYDVSRWGVPQPYPPESVAGPMVCLTNQFAGSDGDIFSHCFKLYGLGPLVGKRTWGGVIGIWPRHRLVDGTITTQPEFSFWFKDVGWRVENYGTDPEYDVDIKPQDYKAGRDPQMEKAIELILKSLKDKPVKLPDFTKRPSLRLPGSKSVVAIKPAGAKAAAKSKPSATAKAKPSRSGALQAPVSAPKAKAKQKPVAAKQKVAAKKVSKPKRQPVAAGRRKK